MERDCVVPPKVFLEKDGSPSSFHLIPPSWTEDDIDAYYAHRWLPSGDQMGLLEVTDEDFDAAQLARPVPAPLTGEPFGDMHYESQGPISEFEAARLAQQVEKRLPQSLLRPYVQHRASKD